MNNLKIHIIKFFPFILLLLSLVLLTVFSSNHPDGLESVLELLSNEKEFEADGFAPFIDYTIRPSFNRALNKFLSALVGMGIIWIVLYFIYKIVLVRRKRIE